MTLRKLVSVFNASASQLLLETASFQQHTLTRKKWLIWMEMSLLIQVISNLQISKFGISRFSLKSRSFTTDFPGGKLRGIPRDLYKSLLHPENYTIPIQMWICPKFKVFWLLSLFIPVFHEADYRKKQWEISVKEKKLLPYLGNYIVIYWIIVSWNVPTRIYFAAAQMRLERKKWAP